MDKKDVIDFFKDKRVQWALVGIVLLVVLISSTSIRLSNLDNLKDQTTGEYLSNDLDSLYFYRVAETQTLLGELPETDDLRAPPRDVGWIPEIIDNVLVWNYKILHLFNSGITFDYAAAISAPILFVFGMILFFILCFLLTKSKLASLISFMLLAYSPGFLFRSIAGFYDHDHLGVFALFILIIISYFVLKNYEKNYKNSVIWGVILGFFTALLLVSWGGAITFVLVVLPLCFLIDYLFNCKNNNECSKKFILVYFVWVIFSVIFTPVLGGNAISMYSRFFNAEGVLVLFVLVFSLISTILAKYNPKIVFINKKNSLWYSLGLTILIGIIGLLIIGKNPLSMVLRAWATLIYPFFGEFASRLSATVAENAQPYLTGLISQIGKILFGLFILGLIYIAINISKESNSKRNRFLIFIAVLSLFFSILFSRISSSSILNGENIISQGLYLIGVLVFIILGLYVYSKEQFKINLQEIILFSIAITIIINARAAIRSFFLITPFICLIAGYGVIELIKHSLKNKDKSLNTLIVSLNILVMILIFVSLFGIPFTTTPGRYDVVSSQAKSVGASANLQWQNAMAWARNKTSEDALFVHWWDYGYFIQTMANRPTVTDGGHAGGGESTDHFIGRYILTTPNPVTAYSFMKTWDVDYLLIDPTDMGKYGAFSKIGSNESWDRVSSGVPAGDVDPSQIRESNDSITKLYPMASCVDRDISYTNDNQKVFLPGISVSKTQNLNCHSYLGAILVTLQNDDNGKNFEQPLGIFVYNNLQYRLPLRYLYFNGKLIDFDNGIDAVAYVVPKIDSNSGTIDLTGAVMYLSPRVFDSLLGRLYVLNDPFKEYSKINLAHKENDPVVDYFSQGTGLELNEFLWYNGLRAPLKIWEVNYPSNTPTYRQFLNLQEDIDSGIYYTSGEMDKYF